MNSFTENEVLQGSLIEVRESFDFRFADNVFYGNYMGGGFMIYFDKAQRHEIDRHSFLGSVADGGGIFNLFGCTSITVKNSIFSPSPFE